MNKLKKHEFDTEVVKKNNTELLAIDPFEIKKVVNELKVYEDEKTKKLILEEYYMNSLNHTRHQLDKLNEDQNEFSNFGLKKNVTKPSKNYY